METVEVMHKQSVEHYLKTFCEASGLNPLKGSFDDENNYYRNNGDVFSFDDIRYAVDNNNVSLLMQ